MPAAAGYFAWGCFDESASAADEFVFHHRLGQLAPFRHDAAQRFEIGPVLDEVFAVDEAVGAALLRGERGPCA
jgi:hypothetical protein